ncbi:MAG: ergothioneine biosynthesis protein EgtB [Thiohalorhabdus sp.]|uniref:ergothioneine biosynthesis protein EgtB n=1 Tax=Thiohalorhabdus sp. TaxID=3094134 RepID=UPI00398012C2
MTSIQNAPDTDRLTDRYRRVRQTTEALCAPLSPEDCLAQSMTEASPAKWHLAHTTWFFETFILEAHQEGFRPFGEQYRVLFNSYYNGIGEQHPRPQRGLLTRPALEEVYAYRAHVDAAIDALLDSPKGEAIAGLVELGLNHEQQHQELILMDLKHLFSCNPLDPVYWRPPSHAGRESPPLTWHHFGEGIRQLGHPGGGFHYDNEGPQHRVFLEPFQIASRPVTCGEYLDFIADGGYRRPELWLEVGWNRLRKEGWEAPQYWRRDADGSWTVFTLRGRRPVDPNEPVCHVSYFEADAFARWAGARLPTEAEWEVATRERPGPRGTFLEDNLLHPVPAPGEGRAPVQMLGDVWEWTGSAYLPYPGYRPPEGAVGEYNGKFMVDQMVLRGGSCATPRSHIRETYRNFFPTDARWPFTGFRLARSGS